MRLKQLARETNSPVKLLFSAFLWLLNSLLNIQVNHFLFLIKKNSNRRKFKSKKVRTENLNFVANQVRGELGLKDDYWTNNLKDHRKTVIRLKRIIFFKKREKNCLILLAIIYLHLHNAPKISELSRNMANKIVVA